MKKVWSKAKKNIFTTLLVLLPLLLVVLFIIFRGKLPEYPNSSFRSILEIIYFITSAFLLIVGIVGLKQLGIAKESSKMNARRESFKLAAEQCTYFLNHILPPSNEISAIMRSKSISDLGEVKITVKGDEVKYQIKIKRENYNIAVLDSDLMREISHLLNSIEGFAVFFTQKVADEKVAFSSIGHTYCSIVGRLLPIIVPGSDYGKRGYSNIIKLYIAWKQKIEKEEALKEKMEAEKKIKDTVTIDFKSLGT